MEQKVFFFDDRILNSIEILRHSRSSVLKCSFVTTQVPLEDTTSFSVLTWVVYSLHECFSLVVYNLIYSYHFVKRSNIVYVLVNYLHVLQTSYVMLGLTSEP